MLSISVALQRFFTHHTHTISIVLFLIFLLILVLPISIAYRIIAVQLWTSLSLTHIASIRVAMIFPISWMILDIVVIAAAPSDWYSSSHDIDEGPPWVWLALGIWVGSLFLATEAPIAAPIVALFSQIVFDCGYFSESWVFPDGCWHYIFYLPEEFHGHPEDRFFQDHTLVVA